MKVTQMANNQFSILTNGEEVFQSYKSIIAIKRTNWGMGEVSLSPHYDYSRTTMKYLKAFLGHGIAETRARIKSGQYVLDIDTNGEKLKCDK